MSCQPMYISPNSYTGANGIIRTGKREAFDNDCNDGK